jgi:hypothetical protein
MSSCARHFAEKNVCLDRKGCLKGCAGGCVGGVRIHAPGRALWKDRDPSQLDKYKQAPIVVYGLSDTDEHIALFGD